MMEMVQLALMLDFGTIIGSYKPTSELALAVGNRECHYLAGHGLLFRHWEKPVPRLYLKSFLRNSTLKYPSETGCFIFVDK